MNYEIVGIGEICDFVRGVTFDGNEVLSEKLDGYVPILRAGNISDTLEIQNDLVWVPSKRVSKEQYLLNYDIAICMASGSPSVLGKTAQVTQKFIGSVGAFCGIIRVKKADPSFIGYYFKSSAFMKWRDRQARGINIQNLRPTEVQEIQIPLPSLPEQQRIAAILQKADRLRRLRRYARQLSDGYLQSVFLEMFGDPATNSKGWNIVLLKDLVRPRDKINYGVVQPGENFPGGVPIIRVGDFDDIPENTNRLKRIDPNIESEYKKSRLRGDEILIGCVGSIGKIVLIDERLKDFNIVRATARVPVGNLINRLFLAEYLKTQYVQEYFIKETRTVSQPTLNIEQIEAIPVPVPPIYEQERFINTVNLFLHFKIQQRESEHQAEMLFQSLLQRAFQGEL